jgi:hypothetical protein
MGMRATHRARLYQALSLQKEMWQETERRDTLTEAKVVKIIFIR